MMKLTLAIGMIAIAISSINAGVLIIDGFAKVNGWTFYKIKTKGTMTNFNVHKTCESNNLITPCYTGTYDTFNSEACQVVFPKTVTEDADTMQYLSIMICGHREPGNCEILQDLFVYKENWVGDSACGSLEEKYCSYGEQFNNLWALCVGEDENARASNTTATEPAEETGAEIETETTETARR